MIIRFTGAEGDAKYPQWIPYEGFFEIESNGDNGFNLTAQTDIGKVDLFTRGSIAEIEAKISAMAEAAKAGTAEYKLSEDTPA